MTPAELKTLAKDLRGLIDRVPCEPGFAAVRSDIRRAANTADSIVLAPVKPAGPPVQAKAADPPAAP